jgi:hypothetical protein
MRRCRSYAAPMHTKASATLLLRRKYLRSCSQEISVVECAGQKHRPEMCDVDAAQDASYHHVRTRQKLVIKDRLRSSVLSGSLARHMVTGLAVF